MSSRREFFREAAGVAAGVALATAGRGEAAPAVAPAEAKAEQNNPPFEQGEYQTFPRQSVIIGKMRYQVYQDIDLGTLGPDVDTIFGMDFEGDIKTGALVVHQPEGKVLETRVVGIKRTDLETVQLSEVLGGDRFDEHKVSDWGGDKGLDERARNHAQNTARKHQKVVYVGDLGAFQKQYGDKEGVLLKRMIRAQRWADPKLNGSNGIPTPDFVNERVYNK